MKILCKYIFVFLLIMINSSSSIHAQETDKVKIIVNKNNPINEMKKNQISNLFLKKVTRWDSDQEVFPVDLIAGNSVRDIFSDKIHGKSVSVIKAYWQTQIFSGRSIPPAEKESDEDVLQYVEKHNGAIGYVSADKDLKNLDVKVITLSD